MKRVLPPDATQGGKPAVPPLPAPNQDVFPNVLPREIAGQILDRLFPPGAMANGRLPRIAETVSRLSLVSRDTAKLIAWYFQEGPGEGMRETLALYFWRHLLDLGERPEHVRHTLLQRFAHLEVEGHIGSRFYYGDNRNSLARQCRSISFSGRNAFYTNDMATWSGKLLGWICLVRGNDLAVFAEFLRLNEREVDLDIDVRCRPDEFPAATYRGITHAPWEWRGELRFNGVGAPNLLYSLLPVLSRNGWRIGWDNARVVASAGQLALPSAGAPSLRGRYLHQFGNGAAQECGCRPVNAIEFGSPPESVRRLVFEGVSLNGHFSQATLRSLRWESMTCVHDLDPAVLRDQRDIDTAVLLLQSEPYEIVEGSGVADEFDVIDALAHAEQLRHLHVRLGGGEGAPCALDMISSNPDLESLSLDLSGEHHPELLGTLFTLSALIRLDLSNIRISCLPAEGFRDFLAACVSLVELRLHGFIPGVDTDQWLARIEPVLATLPGLQWIELHRRPIERLATLCQESGRGEISLCDGHAVRVVQRLQGANPQ